MALAKTNKQQDRQPHIGMGNTCILLWLHAFIIVAATYVILYTALSSLWHCNPFTYYINL